MTILDILQQDTGERPTIVPVRSKNDLVSFENSFYRNSAPSTNTDQWTHTLLSNGTDASLFQRDRDRGAWTFHANSERDLLNHVEHGLADVLAADDLEMSDVESSEAILRSIDLYCLGKQWMYHVGHEKGEEIKPFLRESIEAFRCGGGGSKKDERFVMVELGTYCGYSAMLLAATVRKYDPTLNFHLYSTEIDAAHLDIARRMIKMAKLEPYITLLLMGPNAATESLPEVLARHIPEHKIDFLFLDHAKDSYLADLVQLESTRFVKKGTRVVADNVIIAEQLEQYRNYIGRLAYENVVETYLVEGKLEYSKTLKDGMEFTTYLQDPQ